MSNTEPVNYSGRVEIHGKIALKQFYPQGSSDADTVQIKLTPESVRFRKNNTEAWKENLQVLDDAFYNDGNSKEPVVKYKNQPDRKYLKIRLQGIDAPELHYDADKGDLFLPDDQFTEFNKLGKRKYRQKWAAKATSELSKLLTAYSYEEQGEKFIKAYAFSMVDTPNDLFDRYGRAVADIVITDTDININQWLVKEGWAFPDFYNSMSSEEIKILIDSGSHASNPPIGIRTDYSKSLVPFDFDLVLREDKQIDLENDKGPINLPKFFRKQVDYEVLRRIGVNRFNLLRDYIKFRKNKCYRTVEFLEKRSDARIYELFELINENNYIDIGIGDIVNIESQAEIIDENGNIINEWY